VLAFFRRQNGRAFFPPLPIAALLCRSWHWADSNGAAWDVSMRIAWLRSTEKTGLIFSLQLALSIHK